MSIENNNAEDRFEQELEDFFFNQTEDGFSYGKLNATQDFDDEPYDAVSQDDIDNEIAALAADQLNNHQIDPALQNVADEVAQAIDVAEQISAADESENDESEIVNGQDRVSIDEGFEDAFIGAMDKETKERITNINLLNTLLDNEADSEQRKVIEENLGKERDYIRKKDFDEHQQWKEWAKKREFNPKAPSPDDAFLALLKELGMTKKNNFNISLNGIGFKVIDNANGSTVLQKNSGRCLISRSQVNEKTVSLALLSVGQKAGKAVWVYEPKPNSHAGTEAYYRTVIESAIKLHNEGKIKTQLNDIKIGNSHYKYILEEYRNKVSQNAVLGEENKALNSNEQNNGAEQEPDTKPMKTAIEKHVFDATYNLEKAVEKTINRVKLSTSFSKNSTARGTLDAISDIMNDKPYVARTMSKSDYVTIKAFTDLNKEMNVYKEQMDKLDTKTPEIERNLKIIDTLQATGFNPYSANKKVGMLLGDAATHTMKNVLKSLEVLDSNIRRGEDLGYTSTRYSNSANIFRERGSLFSELKASLESALIDKDVSKISDRVDVVSGHTLNRVLHKKGGSKVFPDAAKVTKFSLAGESIDMYFFEDKSGTVYEVKGTGNKFSKPEVSNLTTKNIQDLANLVGTATPYSLKIKTPEPETAPAPLKVEPVEMTKADASPAADPVTVEYVVSGQKAESTKAASEPDKVKTYTIQGEKNKPDFDMTFTNGVCVRDSVAYYIKNEVDEKSILDDIKNSHSGLMQIKKLDFMPIEEYDINNATMKWNSDSHIVNNMWITPTSRGFLLNTNADFHDANEVKAGIRDLVKLNNIDVNKINGTWTLQEFNNDIRDIKSRENFESDFKIGYSALQAVKTEFNNPSVAAVKEAEVTDEPELPKNLSDPANRGPVVKTKNRHKVSI